MQEIASLVKMVEELLPEVVVLAMLDFGSRTKDEAVSGSDLDVRAYVMSRTCLIHQIPAKLMAPIDRVSDIERALCQEHNLKLSEMGWDLTDQLRRLQASGVDQGLPTTRVTIGLCDARAQLAHLAQGTTRGYIEHRIMLTGELLWDQLGYASWLMTLVENSYEELRQDSLRQHIAYLSDLSIVGRYCTEKALHPNSGIVIWVKWAIHYIRTVVSAWSYAIHGRYLAKRPEIVEFLSSRLADTDLESIEKMYALKCDESKRRAFYSGILQNDISTEFELDSLHKKWQGIMYSLLSQASATINSPQPTKPLWNLDLLYPSTLLGWQ